MPDTAADSPEAAKAAIPGIGQVTPPLNAVPNEKSLQFASPPSVTGSDVDSDGLPTEEELHSLRRIPDRIPWICFTVAFVELCERFAYYGTTAVLTNFIQQPLPAGSRTGSDPRPDGQPGALGQGQRASTGLITFNRFWAYFTPLIGGYLADAKWGKLITIHVAILLAMIGHIIMIVSSLPSVITHPNGALGCLSIGILFFGAGVGGFKANIAPLMAEQLKTRRIHVKTLRSGERVLVDPAMTTQRAFMYFYMAVNVGSVAGQISMVYAERYVGFWLSFTLPTIMFVFCPLVLAIFSRKYVKRPPTGSVFGKAMKLIKFACKGKISANPSKTYRNLHTPAFWEDVKPSRVQNKPKFMTFDDAWVDEVARGVKACSVFAFYPLFWLAYNQIDGNLVSQAATMQLRGVPNDLINNLNPIGIIIMIPILDQLVYPLMRRAKLNFTPLKRMCAGFFVACSAMIWAAVLQHYIYKKGACGKFMNACKTKAPINVWAQAGAYILVGLSEIFASITGLEYAFTKAPANMRGLVYGFYYATSAISAAIGQAFVGLSDDPYLEWLYGSVAIIAFFGGIGFWLCFRSWDKQEESMNMLPESSYVGTQNTTQSTLVDEAQLNANQQAQAETKKPLN